jgi:hypothetical protein
VRGPTCRTAGLLPCSLKCLLRRQKPDSPLPLFRQPAAIDGSGGLMLLADQSRVGL